ncbi:hypothetical protein ACO0LM_20590 [Undibacterium sp. Di26W]|uniref:hypothetical protein n=1 Tax=Undibacterium sp. Di26W TaxID=3413035 RepID=UPI003BF32B6E
MLSPKRVVGIDMLEYQPLASAAYSQDHCKFETLALQYENFLSGAAVSKPQMFSVKRRKKKFVELF